MKKLSTTQRIAMIGAMIAATISGGDSANAASADPAKAASAAPVVSAASSATEKMVERERMTIMVSGSGPDVILLPGLSTPRDVWAPLAAKLAPTHRVHLVQLRGFGDAAGANTSGPLVEPIVTDLAAYIVEAGLSQPAIIGHSAGGFTGLLLADRAPAQVGRLLIIDSLPFFPALFDPAATVDSARPQAEMFRAFVAGRPLGAALDNQTLLSQSISAEGRDQVNRWSQTAVPIVSSQIIYDLMTTDMRPRLAGITRPVTILYPLDPAVMTAERADALYRSSYAALPGAQLVRIDGSRHFIMLDQPAAFASAVTTFLDSKY